MRSAACLIVGLILTGLAIAERSQPVRSAPASYGIEPQPHFAHTSAASCSASACHGGGQAGQLGSEHTTWAQRILSIGDHDPHSRAYRSLFNPDSIRIAKLLGGKPAHENILCLKCHAPAGVEDHTARAEGVGCIACHGPGDKWLAEHYLPSWEEKTNREKWIETGFIPTKNLVARISNCASCHVGSADREVNHDLIAAGHPRLAFEYTRFHFQGNYRKHWDERTPQPDFEVRAWTIGQAVSLRAAIDVLKSRAEKAGKNAAPWPEFAGLSCYACHQSIGGESKDVGGKESSLSQPGWELWYTASIDRAAIAGRTVSGGFQQAPAYWNLKKLMATPNPKPAEVAKKAAAALAELDAWIARLQSADDANVFITNSGTVAEQVVRELATDATGAAEWDELASRYLGCAAMYHAAGGAQGHPNWTASLNELREELGFPRIGSVRFDSPASFSRTKRNRVHEIFGRLKGEPR